MRKPYEFFGPQTWATIREQYLAGASAKTLSTRYGPTVDAIRGRITREGWSKVAHATALEGEPRPPTKKSKGRARQYRAPDEVIQHHIQHISGSGENGAEGVTSAPPSSLASGPRTAREVLDASVLACGRLVKEGRVSEAAALMRTVRELCDVYKEYGPPAPPPEEPPGEPVDEGVCWPTLRTTIEWAADVVEELFDPDPEQPCFKARMVFDFRARHLGPEVGDRDLERARAQGWAHKVWGEDGVLMDPTPESVVAKRAKRRS